MIITFFNRGIVFGAVTPNPLPLELALDKKRYPNIHNEKQNGEEL